MARLLGLHIRDNQDMVSIAAKIDRLRLDCCQFFLPPSAGSWRVVLPVPVYIHASYAINAADPVKKDHPLLRYEMSCMRSLGCHCLVLHPGSALPYQAGIDAITRLLSRMSAFYPHTTILLENVAFGPPSIGGDIADFARIKEKLDKPELLRICLDTAHAHLFGYDISSTVGMIRLIDYIDNLVGLEHIALIHLNDTLDMAGYRHDTHCRMGTGLLREGLRALVCDARCAHIPLVLELPAVTEQEERDDCALALSWFL